jgi:PAS domain-containing protein
VDTLPRSFDSSPLAALRDDAALQEASCRLRAMEERYKALIRNSGEALWCYELRRPVPITLAPDEQVNRFFADGILVEASDAMARMYGLEYAASLIGSSLQELLPDAPKNRAYLRAFVESGYSLENAESVEVGQDGEERRFLNTLFGLIENGHIIRAWGMQRDITMQHRAETERRASQEFLQAALDALAAHIAIVDSDGVILAVNAAWRNFAGAKRL